MTVQNEIRARLRRMKELVDEFEPDEFLLIAGMVVGRLVQDYGKARARELFESGINFNPERKPDA